MAEGATVTIVNLNEFRSALRRAINETPRELTKALKLAGVPVVRRAGELAPSGSRKDDKHPGALKGSYGTSVRGTTGTIVSKVPYGPGAEWGIHGKWKGFINYGPRGKRFAGRAVDELADEIVRLVTLGLNDVLEIYGFAT